MEGVRREGGREGWMETVKLSNTQALNYMSSGARVICYKRCLLYSSAYYSPHITQNRKMWSLTNREANACHVS